MSENLIYVFDTQGRYSSTIGQFSGLWLRFNQPAGLAVDIEGYLYVADTGNNRILKLDDNGKRVFEISPVEGDLRSPSQIVVAVDETRDLPFVSEVVTVGGVTSGMRVAVIRNL